MTSRRAAVAIATGLVGSGCVLVSGVDTAKEECLLQVGGSVNRTRQRASKTIAPNWGCGLVGYLPGISRDGVATGETKRLIDGIKGSSDFNKATYWNWNVAPQNTGGHAEYLTSDIIFVPEIWGVNAAVEHGPGAPREAGKANFADMMGGTSPAEMATILLGSNEPDIAGSCMGNMFGTCVKSCSDASVASGNCPVSMPGGPPATANEWGECNCWQFSHSTGVGFWNLAGCANPQPLPGLFDMPQLSAVREHRDGCVEGNRACGGGEGLRVPFHSVGGGRDQLRQEVHRDRVRVRRVGRVRLQGRLLRVPAIRRFSFLWQRLPAGDPQDLRRLPSEGRRRGQDHGGLPVRPGGNRQRGRHAQLRRLRDRRA